MKKIIILIIAVFVLLLIIGGVFLWQKGNSKLDKYIIKEGIVENATAGLIIKIPDNWKAEIGDIGGEGVVSFYCPNTELYPTGSLKEGCLIRAEVLDCSKKNSMTKVDLDQTENIINNLPIDQKYKIREISGYKALEESFVREVGGREVSYISIKVPVKERLYQFDVLLVPSADTERYSQLGTLLDAVSIK